MRFTLGAGVTQADEKLFGLKHGADLSRNDRRIPLQLRFMLCEFLTGFSTQCTQQAMT
jgi:hypothetical protein